MKHNGGNISLGFTTCGFYALCIMFERCFIVHLLIHFLCETKLDFFFLVIGLYV